PLHHCSHVQCRSCPTRDSWLVGFASTACHLRRHHDFLLVSLIQRIFLFRRLIKGGLTTAPIILEVPARGNLKPLGSSRWQSKSSQLSCSVSASFLCRSHHAGLSTTAT